jgi:two-component system, sensor histidine kinase PdtaS
VPTLADLVRDRTGLSVADAGWLHLLVGDWQLLSDLSFADLVLWLPEEAGGAWVAGAHVRPVTGPMVFFEDQVGVRVERGRRVQIDQAYDEGRILRERDPDWHDEDIPVREEAIPVVRQGRAIAVLSRHTNLATARMPSRLELSYLSAADDLARMIASGTFPIAGAPTGSRRGAPRVGDGFVRLDADGVVEYASPNAVSAVHRIGHAGEVMGAALAEVVTPLIRSGDGVDESLALVVRGRAPWRSELEANGATLSLRAIPIVHDEVRTGALVLLRDVSELRRRERELMTKDATIREIHHRVKNNLQTVAALLRLQARRLPDEAASRTALEEAVRRVGAIALVHQTLSQGLDETVAFDDVAAQILTMVAEVARHGEHVAVSRTGSFGLLRAEDATPLALVLTELLTNAVEHGLRRGGAAGSAAAPGEVVVTAERDLDDDGQDVLRVRVADDGRGLPAAFDPAQAGLGTQIVQALVQELRGAIGWAPRAGGGTLVSLELRPRPLGPP